MLPLSIHEVKLTCLELDLTSPELDLICSELDLICSELDLICLELDLICPELNLTCFELNLTCPKLDLTCPEIDLTCPELDLTCPELDLTRRTRGSSDRKSLGDGESSGPWLASGGEGIESRRFDKSDGWPLDATWENRCRSISAGSRVTQMDKVRSWKDQGTAISESPQSIIYDKDRPRGDGGSESATPWGGSFALSALGIS
jgi:hypothetical protein